MKRRNIVIDELRGIAVIIMIIFHFIYQENLWRHSCVNLLDNFGVNVLKLIGQILFIFIAGICCNYSRDNCKRGIFYLYLGLLITLITYEVTPENKITFGILSFIGTAILLYETLKERLNKINLKAGVKIFIILFIIFYLIASEVLLKKLMYNNEMLNKIIYEGYLNFMGLKSPRFKSSDFFPILPWIFIFMAGALWGRNIEEKRCINNKIKLNILSFVGRKSLIIYIIHIPILFIIISVTN